MSVVSINRRLKKAEASARGRIGEQPSFWIWGRTEADIAAVRDGMPETPARGMAVIWLRDDEPPAPRWAKFGDLSKAEEDALWRALERDLDAVRQHDPKAFDREQARSDQRAAMGMTDAELHECIFNLSDRLGHAHGAWRPEAT